MAHIILEVEDLVTRFYTDNGTVHAVNGVSYNLREGETIGVVGESGCGKSVHALSLMRLIPIPPGDITNGKVIYREQDLLKVSDSEMRSVRGGQIAMIFQDPMTSLNPVMSIGKQIMEVLRLHLVMNENQARERAAEMLSLVGIPEPTRRLRSYPHEFSGGMRQRAMIAMSLAANPQILIADEPTTALDVTIQAQILDLVNRLREKLGMAIIWITHDLGILAGLAERMLVMYAGFFVEKAPINELYANPQHPYTIGLLKSLPRMDKREKGSRLIPIVGQPPDLLSPPTGCPFLPRCPYSVERCASENPILEEVSAEHETACWVDVREAQTHEVVG